MIGVVKGCCGLFVSMAVVPLAVILAALLEKPVVTELSHGIPTHLTALGTPEGQGTPVNQTSTSTADGFGTAGLKDMGSGRMFDRIAFVYDSTNKWMSLGLDQYWRQTLVESCLSLKKGDRVLDLATGTADVSILVGQRLRELEADASIDSVIGLDPSGEMLRRGVSKVVDHGLTGIVRLVKGDAQDLSETSNIDANGVTSPSTGIETNSLDKISMSFGIRNVPTRMKALQEMRRVLRPSPTSRVCILEFSLPSGSSLLSQTARLFITRVVPFLGKLATLGKGSEEYQYLEASILKFPAPLDFVAELAREGLRPQTLTSFAFGAVHLYEASPV